MSDELAELDATAQAEGVRRGDWSPLELVEAAIARIERLDPELRALAHRALDPGRARARPGPSEGPFRGVPFLMKDIGGEEAGRPNHMGMRALQDAGWTEAADSALTRRLGGAGLVSLGRTRTPELALLPTTEPECGEAVRNPWSPEHSAGGSSGGAAAAVAAGIVPMAHASDGGGSIRGPASKCGLVGLKPTRARNSFAPGRGERWNGLSCEFAVTRSVRDAAALLDVTAGAEPGDPYAAPAPRRSYLEEVGADPGRLRVGLLARAPRDLAIDPEPAEAARSVAMGLEALGHRVEESHPEALEDPGSVAHYVKIVTANTARALEVVGGRLGRELGEKDVEPLTWALACQGRALSATGLLEALDFIHGFGRRVAGWWESGFDLLLTPTLGRLPAPLGHLSSTPDEPLRAFLRSAPYGVFTLPFNLTGQPAISLPLAWSSSGLPVGVQLVAASGREDLLLRVAAQLEQAMPWAERRPPIHA